MNLQIKDELERLKTDLEVSDGHKNLLSNPVIRLIIGIIPTIGNFALDILHETISDQINERQKALCDYILASPNITSQELYDSEFIMNTVKTFDIAKRLSNNDKIAYLGNLLKNGYLTEAEKISNDEYEEYLHTINHLSFRELRILEIFARYDETPQLLSDGSLNSSYSVKQQERNELFFTEVENVLGIDRGLTISLLSSMQKTGFIMTPVSKGFIMGNKSDMALEKTVYLDNFIKYVSKISN